MMRLVVVSGVATTLGLIVLALLATGIWPALAQPDSAPNAATLTVTSTADGGAGSLRQTIANADSGDTILIPMGVYTLTLGTGLSIGKSLILEGVGSGDIIVQAATSSADATSRVVTITEGNVVISGLTARHGNAGTVSGGGIWIKGGKLDLINATVSDNAAGFGGGIDNSSSMTGKM